MMLSDEGWPSFAGGVLATNQRAELNGSSLTTDSSGNVVARQRYYPYGTIREDASTGVMPTDIGFTGQRLDDTGLMFYGARYYSPMLGRFASADTIVPQPANPQAWNRYAYTVNNPLKYVDPTGHMGTPYDQGGGLMGVWGSGSYGRGNGSEFASYWSIFEFVTSVLAEPVDYAITLSGCASEGCGILEVLGMLAPGLSGKAGRAADDLVGAVAHGGDEALVGTARAVENAGDAIQEGTKLLPSPKTVKHHIFPKLRGNSPRSQKYRDFFENNGINVDDFTVEIADHTHRKTIHAAGNNWVTKWKRWIDENPTASAKDIYQFAGRLMDEYGLSDLPIAPYD